VNVQLTTVHARNWGPIADSAMGVCRRQQHMRNTAIHTHPCGTCLRQHTVPNALTHDRCQRTATMAAASRGRQGHGGLSSAIPPSIASFSLFSPFSHYQPNRLGANT